MLGAEQNEFNTQKVCNIRAIRETDSEQFLLLGKLLEKETQFMMLEPSERAVTVAEHENQLVGFLTALGGNYRRNHHAVHIVISIRQSFTG